MDAQAFWNVIGNYNQQTIMAQIGLFLFIVLTIVLSYMQTIKWAAKFGLGIVNLFIGFGFFALYGTEPIQNICHSPYTYSLDSCFCMKAGTIGMIYLKNPVISNACCCCFILFTL